MRFFYGVRMPGQWWFRLFGVGLAAKRLRDYPLIFSERMGFTRHLSLCGWSVKYLRRMR